MGSLTGVLGAFFQLVEAHLVHGDDVGKLTLVVFSLALQLLVVDLRHEPLVEESADDLHISEKADHTYRVEEVSGRLLVVLVVRQVLLADGVVLKLKRVS